MPSKRTSRRKHRNQKGPLEGVKRTTHDAVEGVKGGVSHTVEGVKKAFD